MKERTASRGGPRIPIVLKGTLRLGEGPESRVLPLVTHDLGAGGGQASLAEPIPVGTRALLRLSLPAERGPAVSIDLPCSIVRVDGAGPAEVALSFGETRSPALETLKKFLYRARERTAR
jgi:hypothetical protein